MGVVTIEKLLHWAFVMEMPLPDEGAIIPVGGFGPWGAVDRLGQLGTMVDEGRVMGWCDGGGMSWVIESADPDAVVVVNAVAGLDSMTLREEDGFDVLAGWPDLGAFGEEAIAKAWSILTRQTEDGRTVLKSAISDLVRRIAVIGTWPKWQADAPKVEMATIEGRPAWFRKVRREVEWNKAGVAIRWAEAEVNGYNKIGKRPYPDAYRKYVLTPDVSGILASRIEYTLTHAALTRLAEDLDGLGGRKVLPPMVPEMPWAGASGLQIGA